MQDKREYCQAATRKHSIRDFEQFVTGWQANTHGRGGNSPLSHTSVGDAMHAVDKA